MKIFILTISLILLTSCGDSLEPSAITTEKQAQIYAGITSAKERARCAGYFNRLDFKTQVIKPEGTNIDGVNYITYNGGKVAGYWDKDSDILVLVDQPNLTAITIHEATHKILFFNDRPRYEATKDHTRPDIFDLAPCQ